MLSGRPVHLAESVAELAVAHLAGEPPSVASLRTEVGKDLDAIVARAIAPRPEDRFATAGELADALERRELRIGRALRSRLPCGRCRTAGIIDLPFCPGCGQDVAWDLRPGPYAVQIVDFEGAEDEGRWAASIAATASWLGERTPARWRSGRAGLSSGCSTCRHR